MDITKVSDRSFKIKGKSGFALLDADNLILESHDGESSRSFETAGEYEVAGISAIGIKTDEGKVFVCEVDGLRICHLGNVTKKLTDSKVSAVGDIDILFLPTISESIELMQQIESYYVIPFGYKSDEELDKFLKESGLPVQKLTKFSLKRDAIIADQTSEIVVFSNS